MADDGEDSNGLEMMILNCLPIFVSKYTNDGVAPLKNATEHLFQSRESNGQISRFAVMYFD